MRTSCMISRRQVSLSQSVSLAHSVLARGQDEKDDDLCGGGLQCSRVGVGVRGFLQCGSTLPQCRRDVSPPAFWWRVGVGGLVRG